MINAVFFIGILVILSADLSTSEGITKVEDRIKNCTELTLLINNAGFGIPGHFSECDIGKHINMIAVHITAAMRLCRAALYGMKKKNCGAIINVSSVAAFTTINESCTYGSTKVFLNHFSESLALELASTEIKVQALCPGFVYTGFHDTEEFKKWDRSAIPKFMWLDPDHVVATSIKALKRNKVIVIPGLFYKFLVWLLSIKSADSLLRNIYKRRLKKA